jgi:hypothetical protein
MTKFSIGGPARVALTVLLAGLLLAAPASAAGPADATATGGSTTLKLGGPTAGLLAVAGVSVKAVSPATKSSAGVKFPISSGTIRPATLLGSINHRGAVRFGLDGKSIVLRSLRVSRTSKGASMSASVAGRRITILRLSLAKAIIKATGASVTASNITATLSPQGARAINKEIGTSLFSAGLRVGTISEKVTLGDVVISGGATTLTPASEITAALSALGVTLTPTGNASQTTNGFSFPITGGKVNARTFAGTVLHNGSGFTASRGAASLTLSDFQITIGATPLLSALVAGTRVNLLALDTSSITIGAVAGGLVGANIGATLTPAAASALNAAFDTTVFSSGLRLGTVAIGVR